MENIDKEIKKYRKKIGQFQLAKSNFKKPIKYKTDFGNIRVYFSSFTEIVSRFLLIISQLVFIFAILSNGFLFARYIVGLMPNLDDIRLSQVYMRVLFFFFAIVPSLFSLFFLIPILICTRVQSLKSWIICFMFWGTLVYLIAIGLAVGNIILLNPKAETYGLKRWILYVPVVTFGISYLLLLFGCYFLSHHINNKIEAAENALAESYYLNRVKIN